MAKEKKTVKSPVFRAAFCSVVKPSVGLSGGDPYYSMKMLFPKDANGQFPENLKEMRELARSAVNARWPNKKPAGLKSPFRDGDTDFENPMDGYAGHIIVGCRSNFKPGIIDKKGNELLTEEEFYAGCYAKAILGAWAYDRGGNRGVSFNLSNILFVRDGERFSGAGDATDDFKDDIEETDTTASEVTEVSKEELFGKENEGNDDVPF